MGASGWHGPWFRHLLRGRGGGVERRWVRWRSVRLPWSGEEDAAELVIGPLAHSMALVLVVDCVTPTTSRVRLSVGGHQPWLPTCVRCRPVIVDRSSGRLDAVPLTPSGQAFMHALGEHNTLLRQNRRSAARGPPA